VDALSDHEIILSPDLAAEERWPTWGPRAALRPVIDRPFPLEGTPAAVRHLEIEHAQAKVVITVR
jgi:hypothetical protein